MFTAIILYFQGQEFCNQVMDRLEMYTGFKHRLTSAYHPQSNGLDERFNQTLKTSLQRLVNEHQMNWDELIDDVLFDAIFLDAWSRSTTSGRRPIVC